jgi:protein-S-isoprenylcysteine O-methyltransferase Ste14
MNVLEHKIPPPLVLLLVAVLMWVIAHYTSAVALSSFVRWILVVGFLIVGFIFAPPAILAFRRKQTTIDPVHIERASTLVTTGPFGYSRNPMYLGLTALLLAWAIYLSAPWALLGPIVFVLFITRFQIIPEEKAMSAKFGSSYEVYCQNVRRWI